MRLYQLTESNDPLILAQSAIAYLEKEKLRYQSNYGVVTSIDNRLGPLRMYLKRNDAGAIMNYLRNDDYLEPWRDEIGLK